MKNKQCYNCIDGGTTREHIIPKFILWPNEEGFFTYCCETCRKSLKWLDDYALDYFKYNFSQNGIIEYEKWFKQQIFQNGSPMSLRTFGEDTVINEDLLMRFIHKVCVGVAYRLYGRLDNSYRLYIFNDFSKLGGYCEYNNPNEKFLTQEQTEIFLKARDKICLDFKSIVDTYGILAYKVNNARVSYTAEHFIHGARWFHISLYKRFNIVCAVADGVTSQIAQARNMMITSLPVAIDITELDILREKIKECECGDKLAFILAGCPTSTESKQLRRSSLKAAGISDTEIETFELSLDDLMNNKGGRERLAYKFIESLRTKRKS